MIALLRALVALVLVGLAYAVNTVAVGLYRASNGGIAIAGALELVARRVGELPAHDSQGGTS